MGRLQSFRKASPKEISAGFRPGLRKRAEDGIRVDTGRKNSLEYEKGHCHSLAYERTAAPCVLRETEKEPGKDTAGADWQHFH